MPVALTALIPTQAAPSNAAALYTSPAGVTTRIDSLTVCNTGGTTVTITIYLVPPGGAAGASTTTTKAQAVLPGQTWNSPNEIGQVLAPGGNITVVASSSGALSITASGLQVTN